MTFIVLIFHSHLGKGYGFFYIGFEQSVRFCDVWLYFLLVVREEIYQFLGCEAIYDLVRA